MNVKWTENEKNFLKANALKMKDQEMAARLTEMSGRRVTLYAVRKMRQLLGVPKPQGRPRKDA